MTLLAWNFKYTIDQKSVPIILGYQILHLKLVSIVFTTCKIQISGLHNLQLESNGPDISNTVYYVTF